MNVIEFNNISKKYGRKKVVDALTDLELSVSKGEIFGFLGPNGAGKSTAIKCLMNLIKPTHGNILLFGESNLELHSRQQVGFLPENPSFYDYLSASEYLDFINNIFNSIEKQDYLKRKDDLLKKFKLFEHKDRYIRSYSKGMVQRVGIAQTLIHDPQLLIWDEPMSGLDPLGRALVKEQMLELKAQGKTIFFSTHITADVEEVCDRVGIIVGGKLQTVKTVHEVMERGIFGYKMRYIDSDNVVHDEEVPKESLTSFLELSNKNRYNILLVEPMRSNLEDFFLEVVNSQ